MTPARSRGGDEPDARRTPGRPAIPLNRIVATALQIVDEEGVAALSMRRLAQRLDSGTATLYRHFPNRAALISHIIDHIFGVIDLDTNELNATDWRQACQTAAQAMFDALSRHQNAAPLLVGQVPIGPNAMALRERVIARLLASGLQPALAARAYATLAHYVLGFAMQLRSHTAEVPLDDAQLYAVFRDVDPSAFPATAAVADTLPVPLADEFTFGLKLILDGLDQLRDP
ncbi:TetR/AcrR family transcriptional regulator [Mycobacterium sp.]|uniref:TetR/AcrR family transcriptional regulator n=1 Tax=Mycobacterium sp. TaxID=1785 RepID=UPI003BA9093E